jgi:predicted alpha/beta-fold hydrolase
MRKTVLQTLRPLVSRISLPLPLFARKKAQSEPAVDADSRGAQQHQVRAGEGVGSARNFNGDGYQTRDPAVKCMTQGPLDQAEPVPGAPELFGQLTSLHRAVIERCHLLTEPYQPTPFLGNGHLQSILGAGLRPRPKINYEREAFRFSDGGRALLDWDTGTMLRPNRDTVQFRDDSPLLVVFPGLTGGSGTKYIRQLVLRARLEGYRTVVANYRGFGLPLQTPMVSTGVDVRDVFELMAHVHGRFPQAPLMLAGFSMGANIMTKYLGLKSSTELQAGVTPVPIRSAVSVSNAFDFQELSRNLESYPNSLLYSRFLAWQIKRNIIKPCLENQDSVRALQQKKAPVDKLLQMSTIREIDDSLCRRMYELDDVDEYYRQSSSGPHVSAVRVPLLCLNARDDPFKGNIPFQAIVDNPHTLLALTEKGGHVCWAQGNPLSMRGSWMIDVMLQYHEAVAALRNEAPAQSALSWPGEG